MRFRNWLNGTTILGAGALAVLTNCTGTTRNEKDAPGARVLVAALARAESCDDLLAKIQADAIARLDYTAKQLQEASKSATGDNSNLGTGGATSAPSEGAATGGTAIGGAPSSAGGTSSIGGTTSGDSTGTGGTTPGGTSSGGAAGGGTTSSPTGHSDTNTQVEGVDEADIVKNDGEHVYLLHGTKLFTLDSWPAESTAIQSSIQIEGDPREMFVQNGKAVVFSVVYDSALYPQGTSGLQDYSGYYYGGPGFTKITVVDESNPAAPAVLRESYIEGDYVSSRLHGNIVRAVMQNGFKVPQFTANIQYTDPWGNPYSEEDVAAQIETWKALMTNAIEATTLEDWLPIERERVNGQIQTVAPRCGDYYVPDPGLTQQGLTAIVSLDLNDIGGKFGGATILGNASTIYANESAFVLAHNDWRWDVGEIDAQEVAMHRFDISGADTHYVASGFVPGYIKNQFSIDEQAGVIRVSTTQQTRTEQTVSGGAIATTVGPTTNQVVTLGTSDDALKVLGSTGAFGEGETTMATRFVGDRAYVVTYRQTDPLFVVDVSDPKNPKVLGSATIAGFSEYMHPLDATHLLTIGQDGDQFGNVLGFQLRIFDVSNPTQPVPTLAFTYAPGGSSEASYNHKAFTYYPEKNLLAFPYVSYSSTYRSSLEVFRVTTSEITQLGSIDHTTLLAQSCGYYPSDPYFYGCSYPTNEVRRGLFIDDFVYSISYGGVLVHNMADLVNAVAAVPLPAPEYYNYYYGGGVGTPPSTGAGGAGGAIDGTGGVVGTGGALTGGAGGAVAIDADASVCDVSRCPAPPTAPDGGTTTTACCTVDDLCGIDLGDGAGCQAVAAL